MVAQAHTRVTSSDVTRVAFDGGLTARGCTSIGIGVSLGLNHMLWRRRMTDALLVGGVLVGAATVLAMTWVAGQADGRAMGQAEAFKEYERGLTRGLDEGWEAGERRGYAEGAAETASEIMQAIADQKAADALAKAKAARADEAMVARVLAGEVVS